MPGFNLYHFNTNFSEYIQDDNSYTEEIHTDLSTLLPSPSILSNDKVSKECENWVHGLPLGSPWSKWGHRNLVLKALSDCKSKNPKE